MPSSSLACRSASITFHGDLMSRIVAKYAQIVLGTPPSEAFHVMPLL